MFNEMKITRYDCFNANSSHKEFSRNVCEIAADKLSPGNARDFN